MHEFTELVNRSIHFGLNALKDAQARLHKALETSGATTLVKSLQMVELHKVVIAVGMFSIFEAMMQDQLGVDDGFAEVRKLLDCQGQMELRERFSQYTDAINVLKHGRGRSHDALLARGDALPFRVKQPDQAFFFEGDVSEISTLIRVDDEFVLACGEVIREVWEAMARQADQPP